MSGLLAVVPLVIGGLAIGLLVLFGALFYLAMHAAGSGAYRAIIEASTKANEPPRWLVPFYWLPGLLAKGVQKGADLAGAAVSRLTQAAFGIVANYLRGWTHLLLLGGGAVADLALTTAAAFERLTGTTIRRAAATAAAPALRAGRRARREAARANSRARRALRRAAAAAAAAAAALRYARRLARRIASQVAALRRLLAELRRTVARHARLIRTLLRRTSAAALTAVVLRTLAKRFPWMFCRRVKLFNRRACGLPDDWITAWFEGALIVWGGLSLAEFVRDAQALTGFVTSFLDGFLRQEGLNLASLPGLPLDE